jgi:mono/diheme cytochrome c family protein
MPSARSRFFLQAALAASAAAAMAAAPDFEKEVQPVLEAHCYQCHANGKKKGGLSFDGVKQLSAAVKEHKLWELVLENVRSGAMPPDEVDQKPTLEDREKIMRWIEEVVFAVDPKNIDPGRITIRRLNRTEYNNTVRDLVGIDFDPADDFPTDDSGYGFDNIGDVLSLPPVLFERYLSAAEKIMSVAILNDHKPRSIRTAVDLMRIQDGPGGATPMSKKIDERESTVKVELPVEGEYEIRMEVSAEKIGPEGTRLETKVDGKPNGLVELRDTRNGSETLKGKFKIEKPGQVTLHFRVANQLEKPVTVRGKPATRSITIRKLDLFSPPQKVVAPPTQIKIFAPGRGQRSLEAAARAIIAHFGLRAFRRPLAPNEIERFMWIYGQAGKKGGNFEQSVQTALTAILVSPHFLFRGELQPEPDNPKAVHQVNEWSLASRLSYFLWSTMPDEALFSHAAKGTLRKNQEAEVRRMLKDPRSEALVKNFAGQWLQIRNLQHVQPDAKTYPEWDSRLAAAMERETELLFEAILREDRSVLEFLSADYTFVNERLARHYGIDGVEGDAFVKVKVPGRRPGGILGHGGFLTLTSNPTRTSPVKRGKYVLENLLGTPPPPAPPDVPSIDDEKREALKGTLRQRMEQHRKDPNCASCHARMDPIGFGLENFDGIGTWRNIDEGAEVDPSGQLVSGEKFEGANELRKILMNEKRADFFRCLAEKMLTYALGRGLEYYDKPAVNRIVAALEKDSKFSTLVLEIVNSVPFQMRRGEGDHRQFSTPKKTTASN